MTDVRLRALGDAAVLAELGSSIDVATVAKVWSYAAELRRSMWRGVLDVVPAYASVLVRYDPLTIDLARVLAWLRGCAERSDRTREAAARRRITI
ncbi:MAG TPA: carboxyltransferase domain-containing protein, partial [Candidatus Eremiobacteraceae bacterium]|nr:carboxyltransferase domain-containing protein [Candidatus Eremiobacteraceae bacterium]